MCRLLRKNRSETTEVCISEYDEEKHLKSEREWAYNEGKSEGLGISIEEYQKAKAQSF